MINYDFLHKAEEFYKLNDFKLIEVPWLVNSEINEITKPKESKPFTVVELNKQLVASAEQSFLQLVYDNKLTSGKFQATSPCFRDEVVTNKNRQYFMKNELIILNPNENDLKNTIHICFKFFKTIVPNLNNLTIVETEIGYDIEYNNIEIGSYGIRQTDKIKWLYATGCAEPRLSYSINKSELGG